MYMYMYVFIGREMDEGGGCGAQRRAQAPPPSSHYGLATTMYILACFVTPFITMIICAHAPRCNVAGRLPVHNHVQSCA